MLKHIDDVIVVEGKDDVAAIKRACDCQIITTHGFGYGYKLINQLKEVSKRKRIIIFTDSDYMGSQIRKDLAKHLPNAKHAYLSQDKSSKEGDIGVENAKPEDILKALENARAVLNKKQIEYSLKDLRENKLVDHADAAKRRKLFCDILSIGYSNGKGLLNKLNSYGISRDEFNLAIEEVNNGKTL